MPMLTALCSQSEIVDSLGVFSEYVAQLEYSRNFLENKDDRSEEENKYLQFINSHLAGIEQLETSEDVYVIKSGKDAETIYDVENNKSVVLTSEIKKVNEAAYQIIEAELAGKFNGGETIVFDASNDGVGIPEENPNLSEDTIAKVSEVYELVKNGEISVRAE